MEKEKEENLKAVEGENEESEALELVLFQVSECYVYLVHFRYPLQLSTGRLNSLGV
jgi:hypothetical protein